MGRLVSLAMSLLVSVSACSFSSAPEAAGRLVVVGDDGNVFTIAPDGAERVDVTTDATPQEPYFQPIWSPDGGDLAFSRRGDSSILVSLADQPLEERRTSSPPFYFSWSPDGAGLTLLRNAGLDGLALDLIAIDGTDVGETEELDLGQPFYFSWSPESDRLVSHAGADRLEVRTIGGEPVALGPPPGSGQAPQWTVDGIVTVIRDGDRQQLALVAEDGASRPLVSASGFVLFVTDPTGSRVAVQPVGPQPTAVDVTFQPVPEAPPNRLSVFDIASGELRGVTSEPAYAFFWSPDGDRLLILGDADRVGELAWSVWEDGETTELVHFVAPSTLVADLVPFFDQYAQSMTLWSPDGAAFAFPGAVEGERGIWVQKVTGDRGLLRVADGAWVAWSPR